MASGQSVASRGQQGGGGYGGGVGVKHGTLSSQKQDAPGTSTQHPPPSLKPQAPGALGQSVSPSLLLGRDLSKQEIEGEKKNLFMTLASIRSRFIIYEEIAQLAQ